MVPKQKYYIIQNDKYGIAFKFDNFSQESFAFTLKMCQQICV